MQNGRLVDVPGGGWCGDTKSVAASLERQANSGHAALDVLNQLRQLAEIQSFILWARNNGVIPTDEFRRSVQPNNSMAAYEVPNWTSGVRSDPRVQLRHQRRITGGTFFNLLHINLVEPSTMARCVLPNWDARRYEFPASGLTFNALENRWDIPPGKYGFVDSWMSKLAATIAACADGQVLEPLTLAKYEEGTEDKESRFGIVPHLQAIQMHGGVLLGIQRGFLDAATDKGLLLSPSRTPLFQRNGEQLHFWNIVDEDPAVGPVAQHLVINDGIVTKASWYKGFLVFDIEIKPGATFREELRARQAANFTRGLERAGARHGVDGSWIWTKAAGPCAKENQSVSDCLQVTEMTADALRAAFGHDLPIEVHQVSAKKWFVALHMSKVRAALDRRWGKMSSSELNEQLALIYEYAKWGFIEEARTKYKQIVARIEGDTVDTILITQLEMVSNEK